MNSKRSIRFMVGAMAGLFTVAQACNAQIADGSPISAESPLTAEYEASSDEQKLLPVEATEVDQVFLDQPMACVDYACCVPCGACPTSRTWVAVAPYAWATAMKGTLTVQGNPSEIDLSLSDLFDLLDDVSGAAQLHAEAGRDDWGLIMDATVLRVQPSMLTPRGIADLDLQVTLVEALGMRRLYGEAPSSVACRPDFTVDALGGIRYYGINQEVFLTPPQGPSMFVAEGESFVDLLVGARMRRKVSDNLDAFVRGDVAGFSIGTSSKFTWNLVAAMQYYCSPGASLIAGYRILDIDESKTTNVGAFGVDLKMHGPFAAINFQF